MASEAVRHTHKSLSELAIRAEEGEPVQGVTGSNLFVKELPYFDYVHSFGIGAWHKFVFGVCKNFVRLLVPKVKPATPVSTMEFSQEKRKH